MTSFVPVRAPKRRRSFADLGVNVKILAAVCTAVAVGILVGLLSLSELSRSSDAAQQLYGSNVANATSIGEVDTAIAEARLALTSHVLSPNDAAKAGNLRQF